MNKGRWRGGEAAAATDESANLPFFLKKNKELHSKRKHSPTLQKKLRIWTAPHFHISHDAGLTHLGKKMAMLDRTVTNTKNYYHLLNKHRVASVYVQIFRFCIADAPIFIYITPNITDLKRLSNTKRKILVSIKRGTLCFQFESNQKFTHLVLSPSLSQDFNNF